MPSDYGDFRLSKSPPWLAGPNGTVWAQQIGSLEDLLADAAKQALKSRFPEMAPADALEQLGAERGMPRGPGEPDADFAARLRAAWDTWPWAGTAFGLLAALRAAGFAADIRIQRALRYTLDAASALVVEQRGAGEWWIDGNEAFWSRFVVLLHPQLAVGISALTAYQGTASDANTAPLPTVTGTPIGRFNITVTVTTGSGPNPAQVSYSVTGDSTQNGTIDPTLGDSFLIGTTGVSISFASSGYNAGWYWTFDTTGLPADGSSDQRRATQLVRRWKPAHATCAAIYAVGAGRTWDSYPTGATWDAQQRDTWDSDLATVVEWST